MNILQKKFKEVNIQTQMGFRGEWKIEIVHPNGEIEKPFGDEMRPNLILNGGLDFIFVPGSVVYADRRFNIPTNCINSAEYGTGNNLATVTDTSLQSFLRSTTAITQTCSTSDNLLEGSRLFTKIFDFAIVTGNTTITEIGIRCVAPFGAETPLFSRFLLPTPVTLLTGQFLRLTYSLKVIVPATINAINIGLISNTFNGNGQFKCVGEWNDIHGSMLSDGTAGPVTLNTAMTLLPFSQTTFPFSGSTNGSGAAAGLIAPAIGGPVAFPDANTNFTGYDLVANSTVIKNDSVSNGTIFVETYAAASLKQQATYIFAANNPSVTGNLGGILFRTRFSNYTSSKPPVGWYWKFNTSQSKDVNFSLAVNIEQSIVRF